MKYVALLRGINVGKNNRIDMKSLKSLFEMNGYCNVSTYINSGNVIFESNKPPKLLMAEIESGLLERTGAKISVLVKGQKGDKGAKRGQATFQEQTRETETEK